MEAQTLDAINGASFWVLMEVVYVVEWSRSTSVVNCSLWMRLSCLRGRTEPL